MNYICEKLFCLFPQLVYYTFKSRWLFLLLFITVLILLYFDKNILSENKNQINENEIRNIWANILSHYVSFGTFLIAFAVWFGNVKRDWKESLPKRLSVKFIHNNNVVMKCDYAYLSGESDIRQMGQQIGAQIAGERQLNFNIADVVWKEKDIIYYVDEEQFKNEYFTNEKLPFRHYTVEYQLFNLPQNLDKKYTYIWTAPFDVQLDKKDKKELQKMNKMNNKNQTNKGFKLQYNKRISLKQKKKYNDDNH